MAIIYPASFMDAMPNSGDATLLGTFNLAPPAQASARSPGVFVLTAPADTAQTASTEVSSVYYNLSATRTYATGALTTQREYRIAAPTYAFVGASTITTAVTFDISGAPIAGTNATITNSYALRVATGSALFGGAVFMTPAAATSGTRAALTVTTPADTGITTTVEQTDVYLNLASTRTWATGAVALQRFVRVAAPTIAFAGASTVTDAITVDIGGAPIAGTNATLTNSYAFRVASGASLFAGALIASSTVSFTSSTALTPVALASGLRTALTVTGAADLAVTATTEQTDVYLNLARTVTWATGAVTDQRFARISRPTIAAAAASTFTNVAVLYVENSAQAGSNATLTNNYAVWVDDGRVRFDGPVVLNDYPVKLTSGAVGAPVDTINTPVGVTSVANGATSKSVTCAACTAETIIHATIMNATSNNVGIRAVIPGAGSFVVHVTGDPGASTAIIAVSITQPGSGV